MKQLGRLKLTQVNSKKLQKKGFGFIERWSLLYQLQLFL